MKNIHMLMWLACVSMSGMMIASSVERYYPLVLSSGENRLYCFAVPKEFVTPSNVKIQVQRPNLVPQTVQATLCSGDDSIVVRPFYGAWLHKDHSGRVVFMSPIALWHGRANAPAVEFDLMRSAVYKFIKDAQPFFASLDKKASVSDKTGCDRT